MSKKMKTNSNALPHEQIVVLGDYEYCNVDMPPYGLFKAMPGTLAVAMLPAKDRVGSILLPDNVGRWFRPDVGRVFASGIDGIDYCDDVLVSYRRGKVVSNLRGNDWNVPEARFFGFSGDDVKVYVGEFALGKVVNGTLSPLANNVCVKLNVIKEERGISLSEPYYDAVSEVIACGPLCDTVKSGDRVIIHQSASHVYERGDDFHLAVVSEDYIYATIS